MIRSVSGRCGTSWRYWTGRSSGGCGERSVYSGCWFPTDCASVDVIECWQNAVESCSLQRTGARADGRTQGERLILTIHSSANGHSLCARRNLHATECWSREMSQQVMILLEKIKILRDRTQRL